MSSATLEFDARPALSVADYARSRRIDRHKVTDLIDAGELQAIDVSSPGSRKRIWRIPVAAIEAFEARRSSAGPSPSPRRRRTIAPPVTRHFR
jgi:hypothetical protein